MASHGPVGYGLMGLTFPGANIPEDQAIEAMHTAIQFGCTIWNGGIFYGTAEKNSLTLLRKYFEKYPEDATKVELNIKGCFDMSKMEPTGSRDAVLRDVQKAIEQLPPEIKKIDMFEPARIDRAVPLEETMNALRECQEKGWIGGIALSEASAETIRKASQIVKVLAVEYELGLFTTDALTNGVAKACADLGIPIHAYGALGKGFLTGQIKSLDDLAENDFRRRFPRFQPENFDNNLKLVDGITKIAERKGCTNGQVAIGWLLAISGNPGIPKIIPIPGASKAERVRENAKAAELNPQEVEEINAILAQCEVKGDRYPAHIMHHLNG